MTVEKRISDLIAHASRQSRGRSIARRKTRDPTRPAASWVATTRIGATTGSALSVVLGTIGCSHARGDAGGCTMCSYLLDGSSHSPTSDEIVQQFSQSLSKLKRCARPLSVKVYTSGSFFDEEEVPLDARSRILEMVLQYKGISELVLESRPEYVTKRALSDVVEHTKKMAVEIGIGLESSSDRVRSLCINKGFDFADFEDAVKQTRGVGVGVRAYVLMKPPFLTELDAMVDAKTTIADALSTGVTTISLNPVNIQKNTLVEYLWRRSRYRSPWLWSVIDVLKHARSIADEKVNIICDPVAAGKRRGAHNCGDCDEGVVASISEFVLTQDPRHLRKGQCSCLGLWNHTLVHEDVTHLVHQ